MEATDSTAKQAICVGDMVDVIKPPNFGPPGGVYRRCYVSAVGIECESLVAWVQIFGMTTEKIDQKYLALRTWKPCGECDGGIENNKDPAEPRHCRECAGKGGEWVLR